MSEEAPHVPTRRAPTRAAARTRPRRVGRLLTACLLLTGAACLSAQAAHPPESAGRRCERPAAFYEEKGYVVSRIRVATVIDFLDVAKRELEAELAAAQAELQPQGRGLAEGQAFRNIDGYFALHAKLAERLQTLRPGERFSFAYVAPYLDACDDEAAPPTLEVVYKVFSTEPLSYATSIAEKPFDKITRALVPQKLLAGVSEAFPEPLVGYNRSRKLFAGAHVSESSEGGLFNEFDAEATGSGSSAEVDTGIAGTRDFEGAVSHLEWRLGYHYSDILSGDVRLKEGTGLGQLFGATRPLGPGVVLRFGGSVEAGNRQSDLPQSAIPTGDPADSGHGAAKMYLGGTQNLGRQAWAASYGLQLGQRARGWRLDYVKHVFDAGYNLRLLAREHRPFTFDARLSAGWIQGDPGGVPVAERFFGGNASEEFIQGDSWRINSGPLIRSFPQNRLNRTGLGVPIGGENFFSANLTLAQTVWGRPAIPAEIRRDADFNVQFGSTILNLRNINVGQDVLDSADFKRAKELLAEKFPPLLAALGEVLGRIPEEGLPEEVSDILSQARDDVESASDSAEDGDIRSVLLGFGGSDPYLASIRDGVGALGEKLPAHSAALAEAAKGFGDAEREVLTHYGNAQALGFVDPKEFETLLGRLPELNAVLEKVRDLAAGLPPAAPPGAPEECADYAAAVSAVKVYTKAALDESGNAQADAGKREGVTKLSFEKLFKGQGSLFPARLASVVFSIRDLEKQSACVGRGGDAAPLSAQAEIIARLLPELAREYDKLPTPELERKANRDLAYTGRVLDVIFRELNVVSLSPVFMFDAARIGPQTVTGGGFRYGVGGGVRLSIVTLDITAGYSLNPNRRPGEGRGAFVFSLDVSDLFR